MTRALPPKARCLRLRGCIIELFCHFEVIPLPLRGHQRGPASEHPKPDTMKIQILPAVALLALLALHAAQGAALGGAEEETTVGNYAAGSEGFNSQFLNLDKLQSAFKTDDFLNWHALTDMFKKALPFINWEFFPKVKGLRSAVPDSQ
ncbi:keratinocyte differentiation-associated protein [Alexandromys fortis]|nr:keratinocyte differentiation-associated protein [Microtus fortis]